MFSIAVRRRQYGLTQTELANLIGVTQGAVSQWELGLSKPSIANLIELSAVFDCTIDDLIDDQDK